MSKRHDDVRWLVCALSETRGRVWVVPVPRKLSRVHAHPHPKDPPIFRPHRVTARDAAGMMPAQRAGAPPGRTSPATRCDSGHPHDAGRTGIRTHRWSRSVIIARSASSVNSTRAGHEQAPTRASSRRGHGGAHRLAMKRASEPRDRPRRGTGAALRHDLAGVGAPAVDRTALAVIRRGSGWSRAATCRS